jgi:hypothetical protein
MPIPELEVFALPSAEQIFAQRLAELHARPPSATDGQPGATFMDDIHLQELTVMFDTFLGADYDRQKLHDVATLQRALHLRQADMLQRLQQRTLSATAYVAAHNLALRELFEHCQRLLGQPDFEQLFGAPIGELQGYIDLDTFLRQPLPGDTPTAQSAGGR